MGIGKEQGRYSLVVPAHVRTILSALAAVAALASHAGTITVTKPTTGDFLGKSNTVSFNIENSVTEVTVKVTATQVADPTVQISTSKKFTPDGFGKVTGSVTLNLSSGLPSGPYTVVVEATEAGNPYNSVPPIAVTVDVKDPEFLQFNPINGAFVRDNVNIFSSFLEDNMEEWRVQINAADIPNNTGNTNVLSVLWNANLEIEDGQKTVNISAKDKAGNTKNQSFSVTLDRVAPTSTILAPTGNETILPGTNLAVVIDIVDQFAAAVDERTVEVKLEDISGNFIGRVARRSVRNSGTTLSWSGRIRNIGDLPSSFDIVVTATDKAGNRATDQRVRVSRGRAADGYVPETEEGSETVQGTVGRTLTKWEIVRKYQGRRGGKVVKQNNGN